MSVEKTKATHRKIFRNIAFSTQDDLALIDYEYLFLKSQFLLIPL